MIEEYKKDIFNELCITITADNISEIREKSLEKNSARIFEGDKIYSSNFLGKISNSELKEKALGNKLLAIDYNYEVASDIEVVSTVGKKLDDKTVVANTNELLNHFKQKLPDFIYTGKVNYEEVSKDLQVSTNIKLKEEINISSGYMIMKRKGSPNIMDSFMHFQNATGEINLSAFDRIIELHEKWDNQVSIEAGKYPVLFVDERGFLAKLRESYQPEMYHQNAALYSDKAGQKLFNEKISLVELADAKEYGVLKEFDDEGHLVNKDYPIIDKGVFTGAIYDKKMAKKYGKNPTGHAHRSYNRSMSVQTAPLDFIPGNKSLNDIYQEHEKIIIVYMSGGGDTTANGDFSTPVQLGFLVEKGEVKGRLGELTVSNNINKMMGEDFLEIPKEKFYPTPAHSFMCQMDILV